MVLNMADLGMSWKSLHTLWNASKTSVKYFLAASVNVCVDLGRIRQGRNLGDFEQKAWAIAHGFEHGRFGHVLEIAPYSLKRLQNHRKIISGCFCHCMCWFRVNSPGSKFRRFWAKSLGDSPRFWTWPIWACRGNRSKLSETPHKPF